MQNTPQMRPPMMEATTDSMDIPPALASLLIAPPATVGVSQPPSPGLGGSFTGMQSLAPNMPSYQQGGMIGPGGMPIRPDQQGGMPMPGQSMPGQSMPGQSMPGQQAGVTPPGAAAQQLNPQQIMAEAQRFAQQNPQQMQQIQMAVQQGLQSGELTPQELTMITQMAMVALQNPQMYAQLRQLAIQQGLATEQDLSPQFDPGLLFTLLVVGQSMQGGQPGQQAQQPMMSMAAGGPLPTKSPNADGSIPIRAHEGEYVIPSEVVRAKGTEFFDKLVQSYRGESQK